MFVSAVCPAVWPAEPCSGAHAENTRARGSGDEPRMGECPGVGYSCLRMQNCLRIWVRRAQFRDNTLCVHIVPTWERVASVSQIWGAFGHDGGECNVPGSRADFSFTQKLPPFLLNPEKRKKLLALLLPLSSEHRLARVCTPKHRLA